MMAGFRAVPLLQPKLEFKRLDFDRSYYKMRLKIQDSVSTFHDSEKGEGDTFLNVW